MNDYSFGNFLCMLREAKGLTQLDIANIIGVTPAAVSKWENGSSKPRVEVLFRLAQILDVRAEELMAGHYIKSEALDPEAVKSINERYNYLRRVDSYNTSGVKLRRLLAWIIDWNICGLVAIFLASVYLGIFAKDIAANNLWASLGAVFVFLIYPITFVLRDVVFKGRSLGKRITKLVVLDKTTGALAKTGKCLLRNIFLIIVQIDAIVMLVSGSSIGDRAANTIVVLKKDFENGSSNDTENKVSSINNYRAPKPTSTKKIVIIVVSAVLALIILLVSIVFIALGSVKDNEEYILAYNYLINSDAFEKASIKESQIIFNSYSSYSYSNNESIPATRTAEIGFVVKGIPYRVVCHHINGAWEVCNNCTNFN